MIIRMILATCFLILQRCCGQSSPSGFCHFQPVSTQKIRARPHRKSTSACAESASARVEDPQHPCRRSASFRTTIRIWVVTLAQLCPCHPLNHRFQGYVKQFFATLKSWVNTMMLRLALIDSSYRNAEVFYNGIVPNPFYWRMHLLLPFWILVVAILVVMSWCELHFKLPL